jgi:hypothetical protein
MVNRPLTVATAGTGEGREGVRCDPGQGGASSCLAVYVVIVALSAVLFGGDEGAWGEVAPIIGIGLLLFFCPPRGLPNHTVLIGLAGLIVCGLFGFLPSRWFGEPEWHGAIRRAIPGIANAVSLQPWYGFQRFGVMLAVMLFAVWLIQWRPRNRLRCLKILTGGIAVVAMIALAARGYGVAVPGGIPRKALDRSPIGIRPGR